MSYTKNYRKHGWLVFFSSIPSRPVNSRVKIWRRLSRAGAVQLKGSVYVLPFTEEHVELLQRLVSEIAAMKGDAAFVRAQQIDTMPDAQIVELFNRRAASDYQKVVKLLDAVERKLNVAVQGTGGASARGLTNQIAKIRRNFEEAQRTDFFHCESGKDLQQRITRAQNTLRSIAKPGKPGAMAVAVITPRSLADFAGRTWATSEKPFVDRMATAWLVRKFVDPGTRFAILEEGQAGRPSVDMVLFDVRDGDFTHVGDLCTFEVVMRAFALKDPALTKMAGIVHDLDLKDDRYQDPAAAGVEELLGGIRKAAHDDLDALERGMAVFETLYAAKSN